MTETRKQREERWLEHTYLACIEHGATSGNFPEHSRNIHLWAESKPGTSESLRELMLNDARFGHNSVGDGFWAIPESDQ